MRTPKEVLITGERHLIIHGQIGNLQAKLNALVKILRDQDMEDFFPYADELQTELDFLGRYYPAVDGDVIPVTELALHRAGDPPSPEFAQHREQAQLRNALRDMRALMDAAQLSYSHEGTIPCQLNVMLNDRWNTAAEAVGINVVDDIPF